MNLELLARHEGSLLAVALLAYLAAMLLLQAQLFFGANERSEIERIRHARVLRGARCLLWSGAILHALALIGQGSALFSIKAGVAGLFGWITIVSFLAFDFLARDARSGRATPGAFVTPVALLASAYSLTAPVLHRATPAPQQLETNWLLMHVVLILAGYVALAFAFAASLTYLLQDGLLKRKQLSGLWQRLPSLQVADEVIFRATSFGLAMLTLGIFTGIVWQQWHQPNYLVLRDPKVLFSLVTWLIFALYLGARQGLGWRGRRTNLVVVYGFVLLVISFFGAPHALDGSGFTTQGSASEKR